MLKETNDRRHIRIGLCHFREVLRIEIQPFVHDILIIDVDLLRQSKQLADRQCRIEIIIHGLIERGQIFFSLAGQFSCRSCIALLRLQQLVHEGPGLFKTSKARLSLFEALIAEIQRAAVMCLQDEEADHLTRILLEDILDREEVILGLGHLLIVDRNETIVQPVLGKAVIVTDAGLRLSNLILMMREDQITSATVEIKFLTKILERHGRALDMPARTSFAPGAVPARFTRLG